MRSNAVALIIAAVLVACASGSPIVIYIIDVNIIPQEPTILDMVNISVSGGASGSDSWVEYSEFSQEGASLQLDLFVDVGEVTVPSDWAHLEQIGPFSAESYSLTVSVYEYQDLTFKDSSTNGFVVTPEPSGIFLFGLGALVVRCKKPQR